MKNPALNSNRSLLLPYLLPYLLYTGIGSLCHDRVPSEIDYLLRILATGGALAWAWPRYVPLRGPRSAAGSVGVGAAAGLSGTAVWIGLLSPFVHTPAEPWSEAGFWLRALAATLLVPVFEELLMRGYILRLTLLWDRARKAGERDPFAQAFDQGSPDRVSAGDWTPWAIGLATGTFMLGHTLVEWPAASIYGLLMAGLWIVRKDLLSCVIAHAVTNLSLALYVHTTGQWALW